MSKRPLLFIALFGLICAFNGAGWAANPGLVGWWSFDEGAGDIAGDGSGNGNHGQIVNATWTEGQLGSALDFDGTAYVEIPPVVWHGIDRQATLAFWVYGDPAAQPQANFIIAAFVDPGVNGARAFSAHIPWSNSNVYFDTGGTTTNTYDRIQKAATPDEFAGKWQHWALVKNADTGDQSIYLNGALWHTEAGGGNTRPINGADVTGFTVGSKASHENFFVGMIDDVQLYDVALTEGEILLAMEGISTVQAGTPTPEDGAVDVARDVGLSWAAGEFAKTHNVFLGTAFEDANDATVADPKGVMLGQGLTDGSIDAGRLDFGQTYYWRVDEVNGAPDLTVYKGAVWNFEVEPFSIPIDNVTATASSSFGDSGPEKTLDGSGLVDDLHGVSATDMWISAGVPATIEYAFDRAYKLHELWIWNSNQLIEAFVGFGAKDVVIEHSLDGENWTVLDGVGPLAQAPGNDTYAANNMIDFGGATAQHVRVTVNSVQGIAPQASLSEVRFYAIPTLATRPSPASGATDVSPDIPLAWGRDGREAGSHDVYVGTDANNLSLAGSVSESSFDTLAVDLQLGQSYAWRVDEVNEAMDPSTWTGDVWSFTTVDTITVDDMESYKDKEFFEIWATWVDGFDDPANNGAIVGGVTGTPETEIVNGGSQSLPISYDNSAATQSEATRTFDAPMDWTRHGIKSLSLFVFGTAGNSGQLYLKINNTRVDGGPDITQPGWQPWIIDLSTVGGDLQTVTSLTIGVDGANASGTVYIDEIRLYPKAAEWVTPTAPDSANLLAHYTFDGDVTDSSGNGHHGEANGDPVYGDGIDGQALQFDGVDDYVNVVLDIPENGSATSFWFKTTNPDCGLYSVAQNPLGGGGHDRHIFLVNGNVRIRLWNTEILTARGLDVADGQWHHVVHTYGDAIGGQKVYVDGLLMASGTKAQSDFDWQERVHFGFSNDAASDYLEGMLDDARIYDRALTLAEIAWLAGITDPVVVPF